MSVAQNTEASEPFKPLEAAVYVPQELLGMVHVIAEVQHDRQSSAIIMPNGNVELIFFLERNQPERFYLGDDSPSDRAQRNESALLCSVANRPQIVAGRSLHAISAMMAPAAAMSVFGIPASELANRSVAPSQLGIDVRSLEDLLRSLPSFALRARAIETWLVQRVRETEVVPKFLSFRHNLVDLFKNGQEVPVVQQVLDATGYSRVHANRLARQWLGMSLERQGSLLRFRKALSLLNGPLSLAEVAAEAGYFDQAHFTHRFVEYAGITPGQYRLTPRTGAGHLYIA